MLRYRYTVRLVSIVLLSLVMIACTDNDEQAGVDGSAAIGTGSSTSTKPHVEKTPIEETPISTATEELPNLVVGTPQDRSEDNVIDAPPDAAPTEIPISRESRFDENGDGKYTYEELERAVSALLPSYEFPPNYQVTLNTLMSPMKPFADDATWRVPMEYSVLGTYHQCAWQLAWLDAYHDGDNKMMDKSLDQLETVALQDPTVDASLRDHMVEMYQKAALGDPSLMQNFVDTSCHMEWAAPSSSTPNARIL